jgi:hypothetical protein
LDRVVSPLPTSAVASSGVFAPVKSFGDGVGGAGGAALLLEGEKALGGGCLGREEGCAFGAAFFVVAKHLFAVIARKLCVCVKCRFTGLQV